jgi:hypothetical protein
MIHKQHQDGAHGSLITTRQPDDLKVAPDLSSKGSLQRSANMGIIRREKSDNYSVIYNECFQNPELSARAKGIFAYLMTLPDDWKIYKRELSKHFKEGRDALNSGFEELEACGYITKKPERGTDGRLGGWDYTVYESTDLLKTRNTVNPLDGESVTTKYLPSLNTKETNSVPVEEGRESNNKSSSTPAKPRRDAPPTLQEVIQFAQLAGDNNPAYITRAKEAFEFYEKNMRFLNAKVWKDGNGNTVANWKLKIRNNWFKNVTQASGQAKPRAI